ncbi:MAG: hypothetical protein RL508_143 [Actinomycetota bacterium]
MHENDFYRFDGATLVPWQEHASDDRLAAADSWLVENGRVRALDEHYARFGAWVNRFAPQLYPSLSVFYDLVSKATNLDGRWFPRIELHLAAVSTQPNGPAEPSLFLRLREAPESLVDITLWTLDEPDPRAMPLVKGPDLSLGMQIRRKAILHNADEAVILDANGFVEEGALTSIVWWRGDVLCAPDDSIPWLNSVTRNAVFAIARDMGFATRTERAKPADLVGLEIWALSSLHGIRPVVDWVNLGSPVGAIKHYESFAKRLRLLSRQIG